MTPPVFPTPPTPPGDVFNAAAFAAFASNNALFLQKVAYYQECVKFLNDLANWKTSSEQRVALGLPLEQMPTPPVGFPVPVDPAPPVKPIPKDAVVQPRSRPAFDKTGVYPAPGDPNPDGFEMENPFTHSGMIHKVIQKGPFGDSHYWVDVT